PAPSNPCLAVQLRAQALLPSALLGRALLRCHEETPPASHALLSALLIHASRLRASAYLPTWCRGTTISAAGPHGACGVLLNHNLAPPLVWYNLRLRQIANGSAR